MYNILAKKSRLRRTEMRNVLRIDISDGEYPAQEGKTVGRSSRDLTVELLMNEIEINQEGVVAW
jgi:hypothetical protein